MVGYSNSNESSQLFTLAAFGGRQKASPPPPFLSLLKLKGLFFYTARARRRESICGFLCFFVWLVQCWFSGRMRRCHRRDPGSIPGRCKAMSLGRKGMGIHVFWGVWSSASSGHRYIRCTVYNCTVVNYSGYLKTLFVARFQIFKSIINLGNAVVKATILSD